MIARGGVFLSVLLFAVTAFAQADLELIVKPIGPGLEPWPTRFEFTVTNHGPQRATNVRLESPDDIDPLSEWANPTCTRKTADTPWRCAAAVIEPGQSAQFAGNIGPAPSTQPYTFHFSVRADEDDPNLANNDIPVTVDWAEPDDITVDFIPPDPLGTSRVARLVIDNHSDWEMDYIRVELSIYNAKLLSMSPQMQCRDLWPEQTSGFVGLACEFRGIAAHSKQEFALALDVPEQTVQFDVKVIWWLYEWVERQNVVYARPFIVTSTADAGPGSLRQAILDANAQCTKDADIACRIVFAIDEPMPASGWFTIRPFTPLPEIRATWMNVDGFTQQRTSGDSNPLGPDIELDGSLLPAGDGLIFFSSHSEVQGLAVGNFPRHGIVIERNADNLFDNGESTIWHNYVGIDPTGAFARPNGSRGLVVNRGYALIEGNVLSGNNRSGAFLEMRNATVRDNRIGVRAFDDTPVPNGASGIFVNTRPFGYGSMLIERNTIAHNGQFGIALAPAAFPIVQNNRMFANGNAGVDINLDGPTLESSDYRVPPAPSITAIYYDGTRTIVLGNVASIPGQVSATPASVDVYANDHVDNDGFAQGERYLGTTTVHPDGTFTFVYAGDLRETWIAASGVFVINWYYEYQIHTTSELSRAVMAN